MISARLPPLHALRTFEAAARLESFTRAASELGVTQSAVSKQVAQLEDHLGEQLFRRYSRRIELTPEGRLVARAVGVSLSTLTASLGALRDRRPQQIEVLADSDFTRAWLFPRLPDFERQHPEIRISIRAETSLDRAPDDGYDCAFLWGRGDWHNCRFEPLFANAVFPVASPGFLVPFGRALRLADLPSHVLIHDRSSQWWATILASEGIYDVEPELGRVYNQTTLCLEAAARGDGVTVGDEMTTRGYIESGQLIIPFPIRLPSPDAYYFLRPLKAEDNPSVTLFREWLMEAAREHRLWFSKYWAETDRSRETRYGRVP